MKKCFSFLFALIVFSFAFVLNVKADVPVKIKSIKLVSKSEATKILNEPKFEGTDLNLNLQLYKVGDYAEYKVTLANTLDEPVIIQNNGKSVKKDNDFLVYNYIWEDNNSTIAAKGNKSFNLRVEYDKPVETTKFDTGGNYVTTDTLKIELNTDDKALINNYKKKNLNILEDSPETGDNLYSYVALIIIAVTLAFDIIYFAVLRKKNKKTNIIIAAISGIFIILSIIVKITFAAAYYSITVNTSVKITKLPKMARSCMSYEHSNENIVSNLEDKYVITYLGNHYNNNCIKWSELVPIDIQGINQGMGGEDVLSYYMNNINLYPVKLVITTTKNMESTYTYGNVEYRLEDTKDISEDQSGSVILGIYKYENSTLLLIGGEGGVIAPDDSSFLFSANEDVVEKEDFVIPKNIMYFVDTFDLKNLDVSNVENMNGMFSLASALNVSSFDISNWQTNNLKYMNIMFEFFGAGAPAFYLDLNKLNTSKVTQMMGTFNNTGYSSPAPNIAVNSWDTSNVTNMSHMFNNFGYVATAFNLNLSKWNTSKVTDMSYMFTGAGFQTARAFSLNLANFDNSKVTNMDHMFSNGIMGTYGSSVKIYALNNMSFTDNNIRDIFYGVVNANITVKDCNTKAILDDEFNRMGFEGENRVISSKDPLQCPNGIR